MRRAFVLLALFIAGCGPQFKDDDEERAYLNNQMRALRSAEDGMNQVIGNLWSNSPEEKKAVEAYLKSSTEQARTARGSGTAPR